ncbi:conserved Plasmodium protein, unknown function [Plasmodium ovale wallikeri]|uniref:5-formyltetrahydrofolate cyclo-ligase n=2 Tax=Plasmodium ovale TaxID=36330 RepID=A0A1C3L5Z3_PLAOA|nr:conserved Plasmodium protein, unknown function [Plasmodium ovale wallikeri]SBT82768.1 conserved Plasmodium protein, unknown function [Plasmodium ovale]
MDWTCRITPIDLRDYLNNCNYKNSNIEIKKKVRSNAKKIRDVMLKRWVTEKRYTLQKYDPTEEQNVEENKKKNDYIITDDNQSHVNVFCEEKDTEHVDCLDIMYTQLVRHVYTLLNSLNVEKKETREFDNTKMYKYTCNYKQVEPHDVEKYLSPYGIRTFDRTAKFFSYNTKNSSILKRGLFDKRSNFNMCIYLPTKKEIDILFIIEKLSYYFYFDLYVPITTEQNRLIFFPFDLENNLLIEHHFNIFVPYLYIFVSSCMQKGRETFHLNGLNIITDKIFHFTFEEKDTILFIPLIAYNMYGCRVGSGKGYYDKTLKGAQLGEKKKIIQQNGEENSGEMDNGEKYTLQILSQKKKKKKDIKIGLSYDLFLYHIDFSESTDILLDYIVNEKNIYHFLF